MMSTITNHLFCYAKFCISRRLVSSSSKISCFAESLPPLSFDFRGLIRSQLSRLCRLRDELRAFPSSLFFRSDESLRTSGFEKDLIVLRRILLLRRPVLAFCLWE
jgi:hypothetical protein